MKNKRSIMLILLICIMISQPVLAESRQAKVKLDNKVQTVKEVKINLNDKLMYTEPMSFIHPKNSYTLVPIRFVTESMGARVEWEQKTKKVTVIQGSKYITMNIDSNIVYINGEKKVLDKTISPKLIESNTMVPFRFLGETLGYEVDYDDKLGIPIINTKKSNDSKDEKNRVEKIVEDKYKNNPSVSIYKTGNMEVKKSNLKNPKRVVLDLMDTTISKTYGEYVFDNISDIDKLRVSQFDARKIYGKDKKVVRVVVDLNEDLADSDIDIIEEKDRIVLLGKSKGLSKPEEKEKPDKKETIVYERKDKSSNLDIYLDKEDTYDISYSNNLIEILLKEDSFTFNGRKNISDDLVKGINVDRVGKFYRIKIGVKKEVDIKDSRNGKKISIELIDKGLASTQNKPNKPVKPGQKTIVIDPGHGGPKPGSMQNGIVEKELALEISKKLNSGLENNGYNTIMTRTEDVDVGFKARADLANNSNADLLISVHANSATPSASGVEVLYNPNDKKYSTGKQSKDLADILSREISNATGSRNRGPKDRPNLVVLRETDNASVMIEVGFISNYEESRLLLEDDYQNKIVQAIIRGLEEYFSLY